MIMVKDLKVTLDAPLSFKNYIDSIVCCYLYQLWQLWSFQPTPCILLCVNSS